MLDPLWGPCGASETGIFWGWPMWLQGRLLLEKMQNNDPKLLFSRLATPTCPKTSWVWFRKLCTWLYLKFSKILGKIPISEAPQGPQEGAKITFLEVTYVTSGTIFARKMQNNAPKLFFSCSATPTWPKPSWVWFRKLCVWLYLRFPKIQGKIPSFELFWYYELPPPFLRGSYIYISQ